MGYKAHIICHTHWDREWYLTKEQFVTKLVRLIDGLLDIIEKAPEYVSFMLDGQTIVIEDYLEIMPQNRERLYNALRTGKLVCGPWYILPDELLISGESHIRNYLAGLSIIREFKSNPTTAYLPDSFGHPAQMPQIIKGLGMDMMVFWRGVPANVDRTEFIWQSPFKDVNLLCVHMPCGYGNSANLPDDLEAAARRVRGMVENLGARSTANVVLLMNGSDHTAAQRNITDIVTGLKDIIPEHDIKLSTLDAFKAELMPCLGELRTVSGELRSGERTMLLGGTLSSRMELKQQNDKVSVAMERYIEPMLSIERLLGGAYYSDGYRSYIWKHILENQPHDSICGCSIDAVHRAMMARYESLSSMQTQLIADIFLRVAELLPSGADGTELLIFQPVQSPAPEYCECDIMLDRVLVQEVDYERSIILNHEPNISHPALPDGVLVLDENGNELPCVIIAANKGYDTLYQDFTLPEIYKNNSLRIGFMFPPQDLGFHRLIVKRSDKGVHVRNTDGDTIENGFYSVISENGALTVTHKRTGRIHKGVHRFIDKGDAGDSYTYSWPDSDGEFSLCTDEINIKKTILPGIAETLTINGVLRLPKELTADRKARVQDIANCPVTITVSLYKDVDRIDIKTSLINRANDHRLQVSYPSGIKAPCSESYNTFNITKRDIGLTVPDQWIEYPQNTHPTHGFINLENGSYGMSVSVKGLTEFEAVDENGQTSINVTLLRSVGWLSRTDLNSRKGNGGWTIATPEAQCRGEYTFETSITFHDGCFRKSGVFGEMERFRLPSLVQQINKSTDGIKREAPIQFCFPETVRLSAIKPSEDGKGLIVRMFCIGERSESAHIFVCDSVKRVFLTNLAENEVRELTMNGGRIDVFLKPAEIMTLKLLCE